MSSIFDLKNDLSEIKSSNQGIRDYHYEQVAPLRGIGGASFPGSEIEYRWTIPRGSWWVPARSYLRLRCFLSKAAATANTKGLQLTVSDGIAPAMGLAASLFQSARMQINDVDVSRTSNQFFSQLDSLETRMSKSRAWLNGVGASINFWESSLDKRIAQTAIETNFELNDVQMNREPLIGIKGQLGGQGDLVFNATTQIVITANLNLVIFTVNSPDIRSVFKVGDIFEVDLGVANSGVIRTKIVDVEEFQMTLEEYDAVDVVAAVIGPFNLNRIRKQAQGAIEFELVWVPPLSIFKLDHALPQGTYRLLLTPHPDPTYKIRAIESLSTKVPGVAGDFEFNVQSMNFYYAFMRSDVVMDNTQYVMDLDETIPHAKPLQSTGSQDITFEVSPSTYALTVALQDSRVGSTSQFPASKFRINNGDELRLSSLQINYANEVKPRTTASWVHNDELVAGGVSSPIDQLTQRYIDTNLYNGRFYSDGGPESIEEYKERGAYYFFAWPKEGSDVSTSVLVKVGFRLPNLTVDTGRIFLFEHKKRVAIVKIANGMVVSVETHDA